MKSINIELFISIGIFVVLFNTGTVTSIAFRIIVNKLPLLPESETSDGISVQNSTECQTLCESSRNYLFAEGTGGPRCLCSNISNPFRYGLVNALGAVFKSEVRDVTGLDHFIYMGIKPVESKEISIEYIEKVISLDTCALLCYNYRPIPCLAFSYDVDLSVPKYCRLFAKPPPGARYEEIARNSTVMYFEYVGSFLIKFSRQWGSLVPSSLYNIGNSKEPLLAKQWHPYFLRNLLICAKQCYTGFQWECEALYYDIQKETCYFNTLPDGVNGTTFHPTFLYFRQDRTEDCSTTPLATSVETGMFRSPGFPYSLTKDPCLWKFLTPWGKALSLTLINVLPQRDTCRETIQINNDTRISTIHTYGTNRICQIDKQIVGQSNNGLNTVILNPSIIESDGIAFVANYSTVWACRPGGLQLLLQGPGAIATTSYPGKMEPSLCRWIISAGKNESKLVTINIQDLDFKSPLILKSATLTFLDIKSKTITCNSTNACKSKKYEFTTPVEIDFQSGLYFENPKGFQLFYDFKTAFPQPELREKTGFNLTDKMQVIQEAMTDLQNRREVNLTYTITNTIADPRFRRIALTLDTFFLGEAVKGSDNATTCINGYMQVTDPAIDGSQYTYLFCKHEGSGTRIISNGNTLIVNVVIPPQDHLATTLPTKSFNFSATHFVDAKEGSIITLNTTMNFTSPNYPGKYPPNQNMGWYIGYVAGKTAVLSFLNVQLGQYQVLTNYFCNNDRLLVETDIDLKYIGCNITQEELPIRFVQHEILFVLLLTSDQYLGSGFKANVQYYNTIGCNVTKDSITINSADQIIQVQYDRSVTGPCEWYVTVDVIIDCVEGCSQVIYIEPLSTNSRIGSFDSTVVDRGSTIRWRGNDRVNWFSAVVNGNGPPILPTTQVPTTTLPLTTTITTTRPIMQKTTSGPPIIKKSTTGPPIRKKSTTSPPIMKKSTTGPPIIKKSTSGPPITKMSTAGPPFPTSTAQISFNTTSNSTGGIALPSQHHGSIQAGGIVGIVFGVLLLLLVIAVVALLLLRRYSYDIEIVDRMRSSFGNISNPFANLRSSFAKISNPFARPSGGTASSPYKSFTNDDKSDSQRKGGFAVKFHKDDNDISLPQNRAHESNGRNHSDLHGHIQIGGIEDTSRDEEV